MGGKNVVFSIQAEVATLLFVFRFGLSRSMAPFSPCGCTPSCGHIIFVCLGWRLRTGTGCADYVVVVTVLNSRWPEAWPFLVVQVYSTVAKSILTLLSPQVLPFWLFNYSTWTCYSNFTHLTCSRFGCYIIFKSVSIPSTRASPFLDIQLRPSLFKCFLVSSLIV